MKRLHTAVRLVIGGLLLYAGLVKVLDPAGFAVDIDHYRIIPYYATASAALLVPPLEILAGGAMFFGILYRGGLMVAFVLSVFFTAAVASATWRGLDITCGCFGGGDRTSLPLALVRDLLIVGGLGGLLRAEFRLR